ncbi:MAG: peptide chain release factor N(5)-glutamine methyltransferase [Sphingobacteriales bacterium]|nr:MAG: peptide chain release factor N(5)-glutamine methyltransferase [Sphingobacteriales bacterium]
MTTVGKLFNELVGELEELYTPEEAINIMRIVFQEKLGLSRVDMALQNEQTIDDKSRKLIFQIAEKLIEGQPVQQLLGSVHFLTAKLRINKNVLIPRPETEELVDIIIKENREEEDLQILDIGTGSGCIAIALANGLDSSVKALDISQPALELARINAIANNAAVDFLNLDILIEENWKKLKTFDIIVSNPPYVLETEKAHMHVNILNHEPHVALFVPEDDPLLFYEKISDMALKHLSKRGILYFEINARFGQETKRMLLDKGFAEVTLRKDMNGKDRFIKACLKAAM